MSMNLAWMSGMTTATDGQPQENNDVWIEIWSVAGAHQHDCRLPFDAQLIAPLTAEGPLQPHSV